MRGLSPRELRRLMKRLGMEMKPIENVSRVIIEAEDRNYIVENPQVLVMTMRTGDTVVQVFGKIREEKREEKRVLEIPEEDVDLVASQTGVSKEEARKALIEAEGDIAAAILLLEARKEG
ncbi:MAG: nascent polypeptide-associated complex protein [Desulfurococcales archaeon ex4484_217_1]|nr:MAG: nascent polypeptide-associated complex protein [Desulfurococcales archaeon ex4484_217_1]